MGKIPAGILGRVQGKVGGIIGQSWKGVAYIKSYTIPANPQTAPQTAHRLKMQTLVYFAKLILTGVIHPFWNPFASGRSGYNDFTSYNLPLLATFEDYTSIRIAKGPLETPSLSGVAIMAEYFPVTGQVSFAWSDVVSGNGLATDIIVQVVIDTANNVGFVFDNPAVLRSTEGVSVQVGTGRTNTDLVCFVFAYRGVGPSALISNSLSDIAE